MSVRLGWMTAHAPRLQGKQALANEPHRGLMITAWGGIAARPTPLCALVW